MTLRDKLWEISGALMLTAVSFSAGWAGGSETTRTNIMNALRDYFVARNDAPFAISAYEGVKAQDDPTPLDVYGVGNAKEGKQIIEDIAKKTFEGTIPVPFEEAFDLTPVFQKAANDEFKLVREEFRRRHGMED